MTPPLTNIQKELLNDLYYKKRMMFGRDKLFKYIQANHESSGISRRQIADWLSKQDVSQLYKPTKTTKKLQPTILKRPYRQLACDLIDMQSYEYNGYKYILSCIDLFSKYAWTRAIKDKTGPKVATAMKSILDSINHEVGSIRSDNGGEFKSEEFEKVLDDEGISQVFSSADTPQSNGGIERFNATIKRMIKMVRTAEDNNDWVKYLPQLTKNYNNTYHRVIKRVPAEVIKKPYDRRENKEIKNNIRKVVLPKNDRDGDGLIKVGNLVRLKLDKKDKKKSNELWTKDIFRVYAKVIPKAKYKPPYYLVKDDNKRYTEKLYANDLQVIDGIENKVKEPEKFEVSMIKDKRRTRNGVEYGVKYKGYRGIFWEPRSELIKDIPKMVRAFDRLNENRGGQ